MSSVPLGELTMLLAISRQSERATRGRPGLRPRGRHAAVPAGRLADAPRPGEERAASR